MDQFKFWLMYRLERMARLFHRLIPSRRRLGVMALTAILVAALLLVGVPWAIQALTISQLTSLTGQEVNLDQVSIQYLDRILTLSGIQVLEKHSRQPIVEIDRVQAHFRLWPLWQGQIRVPQIVIDDPTVELIRTGDGKWNIGQQDQEEEPPSGHTGFTVEVQDVQLNNGTLIYQDFTLSRHPRIQARAINLRLSDLSFQQREPIPVHLTATLSENGRLQADGVMLLSPFSLETKWDIKNLSLASIQDFVSGVPVFSGTVEGTVDVQIPSNEQADLLLKGHANIEDFQLGSQPAPLLTAQHVGFTGVEFSWPGQLDVSQINVQGMIVDVLRDTEGTFPALKAFEVKSPPDVSLESSRSDFSVNFGSIRLQDGTVRFIDRATDPEYRKTLSQIEVIVKGLSTSSNRVGHVTVDASTPEQESVHMEGDIELLGKDMFLDVEGKVKGFLISSVSPYAERWIGWGTPSGRLSTDIRLRIENRQLRSKSKIGISDLRVVRTGSEDVVAKQVGLPLGLIVDLIKNIHGNIHLKVEVEGHLDKPEFSIRDAIWKSVRNAVVNIVTAPLRLIGKLVTSQAKIQAIEIDPILFITGTKTMVDGMDERIRHLQTFLKTTPYIGLRVVPLISAGDLNMLRILAVTSRIAEWEVQRPAAEPGEGSLAIYRKTFPEKFPPDEESARLKELVAIEPVSEDRVAELASERVRIFMNRMTAIQDIFSDRIHIEELKKASGNKDIGGLEFSISR